MHHSFCYLFHNTNGKFISAAQKHFVTTTILEQYQPDAFGLTEPNIPWNRHHRNLIKASMCHHWPHHKLVASNCLSNKIYGNNERQQGGSLQIFHGRHSGRISHFHEDKFGRWVSQTLRLKDNRKLTIITAHRPCQSPIDPKSNTIMCQQCREYRKRGLRTHPRQQFLVDFQKYALKLKLDNHEILIGMDANLTNNDNEFWTFAEKCNLFDIFHKRFNIIAPTHKRGNKLDLLLGTQFILDNVIRTGISDGSKGATSDHSACHVDLHMHIFCENMDPTSPLSRSVTSKQRAKFMKYGNAIDEKISSSAYLQNLLNNIESISCPTELQKILDKIDDAIGHVVQLEDNRFQKIPALIHWSPICKEKMLLRNQARRHVRLCAHAYQPSSHSKISSITTVLRHQRVTSHQKRLLLS